MKQFIQKLESYLQGHKVFIIGLVSAVVLDVQEYFQAKPNWEVVGFSALIAALSYVSKFVGGKVASAAAILATTVTNISVIASGHQVNWYQIGSETVVALLGVLYGASQQQPPVQKP